MSSVDDWSSLYFCVCKVSNTFESRIRKAKQASHMVVEVKLDFLDQKLVVKSGDGQLYEMPFRKIQPSFRCSPNFHRPRIIDSGHTIALGNYQMASSVPILYGRRIGKAGK